MKKRIIIDTDMGADDYIAIQYAILSKKFNIEGISLVDGNTNMANIKRNIFKCLDMVNMNNTIKIYEGESKPLKDFGLLTKDYAHGSNGLSDVKFDDVEGKIENKKAVDWLIETVNNNPQKISIVAIGPLTNIGKAILQDQNFAKNIKELIIMGGANNFGNITPYAEFNFYNDTEATKIVFEAGIKNVIMIGFDVTKNVTLNPKLEKILLDSKDKNAKFIYEITRDTAKLDIEKNKTDGASMNDSVALCYMLHKKILKMKKANVKIETKNINRFAESIVSYEGNLNCKISLKIDSKKCANIIFSTIFPNLKKEIYNNN